MVMGLVKAWGAFTKGTGIKILFMGLEKYSIKMTQK